MPRIDILNKQLAKVFSTLKIRGATLKSGINAALRQSNFEKKDGRLSKNDQNDCDLYRK